MISASAISSRKRSSRARHPTPHAPALAPHRAAEPCQGAWPSGRNWAHPTTGRSGTRCREEHEIHRTLADHLIRDAHTVGRLRIPRYRSLVHNANLRRNQSCAASELVPPPLIAPSRPSLSGGGNAGCTPDTHAIRSSGITRASTLPDGSHDLTTIRKRHIPPVLRLETCGRVEWLRLRLGEEIAASRQGGAPLTTAVPRYSLFLPNVRLPSPNKREQAPRPRFVRAIRVTKVFNEHSFFGADPVDVHRAEQDSGRRCYQPVESQSAAHPDDDRTEVSRMADEAVGAAIDDRLRLPGTERARVVRPRTRIDQMRMPRPATPTATPIHANTESVDVTPTPDVLRTNGPTNATTYATTIKRVLDRSSSPPCQLRASFPFRSTTSRRSHAASRRPESHSVIDGHRLPEGRCRTAFPVPVRHETGATY